MITLPPAGSGNTITDPNLSTPLPPTPAAPPPPGAGNINSAGAAMPTPQPSYALPFVTAALSKVDIASLGASLELWGESVSQGSFDYDSVISTVSDLAIELHGRQRSQAMQQRSAGYEAAKASSMQQAGEMQEAADTMDKGATMSMAIGITTAGVSMIGSGVSLGKQVSSLKSAGKATEEMGKAQTALDAVTTKADNFTEIGRKVPTKLQNQIENAQAAFKMAAMKSSDIDKSIQRFQSAADITSRVGDMGRQLGGGLDAKEQANAKRDEAEGAIDAAEATGHQQKAEMAKEIQTALDDMIKAIMNFVKEMQENEVEMMRAITR